MRILPRAVTKWFWKRVALFAYRRWADPESTKPWGLPRNRDPDNPCAAYEPRTWKLGDWNDCQTDGHALCRECCHRAPTIDGGEESRPGVFSRTRATSIDEIDQWFFEFVVVHMGRFPRADWPRDDYDRFRAFFSPWKIAFVRLGVDWTDADRASLKLLKEGPPVNVADHLPALVRLSAGGNPDVVSITLWSPGR